MIKALFTTTLAISFIYYPEFVAPNSRIEAVTDLGPVLEVVVKCKNGTAIISFSKVERIFCTPKWKCFADMSTAVSKSCN